MNVVYIGNHRHDWCTEVHLTETLRDLGHDVAPAQEDEVQLGVLEDMAGAWADLLLYTRTWSFPALPVSEATGVFRRLEQRGCWTASVHLDLIWGLQREALVTTDALFRTGSVFTADGGHDPQWHEAGVNHHWLPPGVLRRECGTGTPRPEFSSDVLFIGSPPEAYHPEWQHRGELLRFVEAWCAKHDYIFLRLGPGGRQVRGQELNDAIASAAVVLGDSTLLGPRYWSDRVYETVGRGGFLLHPEIPDMGCDLVDGLHWATWPLRNWKALDQQLKVWLDDPVQRKAVAQAGQFHVSTCDTYHERMTVMLEVIDKDRRG